MYKSLNFLLTAFLFILLTACGPAPQEIKDEAISGEIPPAPPVSIEEELTSQTKELSDSQTEKLRHYIELSQTNEGPLKQQYIIELAEWLYQELEFKAALRAIEKVKPEYLPQVQIDKLQLLKTRVLLALGKNIQALQSLPLTLDNFDRRQKIEILDIRSQAFLGANYPFEAIRTRMELMTLLEDQLAIDDNQYKIWRILNLMPLSSLKQINTLPLDAQTKGWVDLAIVTKQNQNNWQELEYVYQQWLKQHPSHIAGETFLATLAKSQTELVKHPKHITLLLPLTNKFAGAARAIRDGFLSAHYNKKDSNAPLISVIDTSNSETPILQHYQKAVLKGSDFIVGPLSKASIDDLSNVQTLNVPVLTLNYAEQQTAVTDNLFQFGLLPEDEARQIAELAIRHGKKHAAILVPATPWGQRIQQAFRTQFEELGGEVRNLRTYQAKRNDFSNSITNLLNLTQSKQRHKRVQQLLGKNTKFEAYRRQDIDMIFIAGLPRAARSILPQLKFHHASDLQVYSTSHAFSGVINARKDRDINQLLYCDIPWVLENNTVKASIEKNWPETNKRYSRLYALGADAYHLIPYLGRLKARSDERFNGYTGNLYLDPLLRVHRELVSARFIDGVPVPLDAANMSLLYQPEATDTDTDSEITN